MTTTDHPSGDHPGSGRHPGVRVAAVIPALDEAQSIARVVEGLRAQALLVSEIIVVDNGSTDGTGEIARRAGARVVREERQGYGYACLAGVLAADDAEVIVLLDGDAADDPNDLPRVLEPLFAGEADLVVGSRVAVPGSRARGSMTWQQVFGNHLAAFLMRALYGVRVSDVGPFRTIRREDLLALEMREMTYGWPSEMIVKSARAGYRYREVPVSYHRRLGVSKVGHTLVGSLKVGWRIISTVLRYSRWTPPKKTQAVRR
jgi:glycosyltransferase involved in cell wall biosynthesis